MSNKLRIGAVRVNNGSADHLHSGQDAANSDTDANDFPPDDYCCQTSHSQSCSGWFGLPYQDHNYVAPPPMSPSPPPMSRSPSPPPPTINRVEEVEEEARVPAVSYEEEVVEDSITRCICGFLHDDGYMICCDMCSVWQHIDCMDIDRNNIPESYCCEQCEPRVLDIERAKIIQQRRKAEILDTSATDTDPEEPANALASLGRKPVQPKPKGSKQRRVSKSGNRLMKSGKLAKSQQLKRDKKLKVTKKEKENVKDALKKQKLSKTGVKERRMKKKLNTSLCQNKADLLNYFNGPLYSVYGGILENEYSNEVLEFLSRVKTNGAHSPHSIGVFPEELLVQLYKVSEIKTNVKGLEATQLIVPGKAVIEFRGRVMLRQHYLPEPLIDQSQPYVLFYSKFEGLDLCIDASAFGGDARFIRRSCTPNAEMCHIIDQGKLQFIVQAKKEIPEGTEITIPFDFDYQESPTYVECACGRSGCPVAKFWKKVKLAQKSPEKPKRKRQSSGEGRVRRNSQGKTSPIKIFTCGSKSPVKANSPMKSPAAVPPVLSLSESSETLDVTVSGDSEFDFPSLVKKAAAARRSSRGTIDQKEEVDTKAAVPSSHHRRDSGGKVTVCQDSVSDTESHYASAAESAVHSTIDTDAESTSDSHRKMTREERKLEAIMKAFEKLEKREERRKEALARLDKKHDHIKEEPVERNGVSHAEPSEDSILDPTSESSINSTLSHLSHSTLSHETDKKPVIKQEDPIQECSDSPTKSVSRHKRSKRKRRNSRAMSAMEPLYTSIPAPLLVPKVEPMPAPVVEVKEEPVDLPVDVPSTAAPCNAPPMDQLPPVAEEPPSYMFNKKRKYLFDPSGSRSPEGPVRDQEVFVSCTPGPRSSLENMQRRYSTSACGRTPDSNRGNAKKRWLRQAMYETVPLPLRVDTDPLSPRSLSTDSCSPLGPVAPPLPPPSATVTSATVASAAALLHSPTGSPSDFVTPLKKRRLAPEFLPSTSSSAVPVTPPMGEQSAHLVMSSNIAESTANSSSIQPASVETVSSENVHPEHMPRTQESVRKVPVLKRPRMKGTCLFGRKKGNGLLMPSSTASSSSEQSVVPEHSDSSASTRGVIALNYLADHLSYLNNHSCSKETGGGVVSTGSLASCTVRNIADSAEAGGGEGSFDSAAASTSSSTAACVIGRLEPGGVEVPLVDSSDTALDTGQASMSPLRTVSSDSVGACSSDNEVSPVCVNSADSENQEEGRSRRDEVMAESSSVASSGRTYPLQDQDEDVSESQPSADRRDVEDEGNEASGSVSVSEELSRHTEQASCAAPQPTADCQVNSSQDFPACRRTSAVCSPSRGEAECRVRAAERVGGAGVGSRGSSERVGVTSALDMDVGRERDRRLFAFMDVWNESFVSSDAECGPSSSTQASHRQPVGMVEPMVCNSSDVTGSSAISFVCEESNVDSTTQSGCVVRVDLNLCDTADSHLQAAESEESCCDSNTDEQTESGGGVREGEGMESCSGPADSQGDDEGVDESGTGSVSTSSSVGLCGTASVSSSHYSTSQAEAAMGTTVSSSVFCSGLGEGGGCVPGLQAAGAASTSSSTLSTTDSSDVSHPSQSTSQQSPSVPSCEEPSASQSFNQESDVDTSGEGEQQYNSVFAQAEQCEPSTSTCSVPRTLEDRDSARPESSGLLQNHNDGELPGSSDRPDTPEDRGAMNGFQVRSVSVVSEDSSSSSGGPNPSATVSSSEAQAAPATKRKVSLSEYRSRRKDKPGCAASASSAASPKSSSDHHSAGSRECADYNVTLATLPLFEPISLRENQKEKERREKPMSLADRLRIEFGVETSEEEDSGSSDEEDRSLGSLLSSVFASSGVAPAACVTAVCPGNSRPATVTATNSNALSSWLSKMHNFPPGAPPPLHQLSTSAPLGSAGIATQQIPPQPYSVAGAGGGGPLSNGSHAPAQSSAFSTPALFTASSSQQVPTNVLSFPASSAKQQQQQQQQTCGVPPPPPSTAYPQYLAQLSQSRSGRAQATTVSGSRHAEQLGPGVSVPSAQQSPASTSPIGNGMPSSHHAALANSSPNNHSHSRFSFNVYSRHGRKGSYAMDRKRH